MYNSASGMFNSAFDTNIIVNSDGNVQFLPPGNFLSTCQVSKLHQWRDTNVLEWLLLYELFSAKSQHRWAMKITQNMCLNTTFMIQYVVDLSYKQFLDDSVLSSVSAVFFFHAALNAKFYWKSLLLHFHSPNSICICSTPAKYWTNGYTVSRE